MYGVQNRCNGPNTIEWGYKECFVIFTFNLFNSYNTVYVHYSFLCKIQLMIQKLRFMIHWAEILMCIIKKAMQISAIFYNPNC